ncbi:putative selenate ABC transporter substrate-binding protein [Marinobacter nanhaiticus D15-8W]|uniref:Putative selenate ABC transporter substrate-binding protein n=1 Tax=Marinobacter nanhaiticus D15-8W TaxID=626887 RepID=N6WZ90_9GAMM|nr:putative selenate ABC transporter substrate-binding protein [Marinobacter nanhaiticus]ENO14083.1 putative selenate ABC transporter substrate-binding protein [Marinobacter nanhaiticus D15-8W]BES71465.1 putative selenate ABC transporter substrate-binding protein [Marinobacter nanhaiticus D15-8W]
MLKPFKRALLLSLALVSPVMAETFVFTAIPDADETKLRERFQSVADYLSEQLEVDVRYIPVKSYAAAVSAFRNNQVQLAWFGGLSGVQARALVPGSEAIAQGEEDTQFVTYFIAHKSTGIEPSEELPEAIEGKTFTFGSKGSTSGRLMPEYYIRETFDAAPEEVFSRVGFSGNHSRTIRLVEAGTYEVGAVNYAVWESEIEEGTVDTDAVSVIWETPPYQDYQWTIRGDVNERFGDGFKEKVQQALVNMDDPELLNKFPRSAFIPASNEDYESIRNTAEKIGIID